MICTHCLKQEAETVVAQDTCYCPDCTATFALVYSRNLADIAKVRGETATARGGTGFIMILFMLFGLAAVVGGILALAVR